MRVCVFVQVQIAARSCCTLQHMLHNSRFQTRPDRQTADRRSSVCVCVCGCVYLFAALLAQVFHPRRIRNVLMQSVCGIIQIDDVMIYD